MDITTEAMAEFPELSNAFTRNVCDPSPNPVKLTAWPKIKADQALPSREYRNPAMPEPSSRAVQVKWQDSALLINPTTIAVTCTDGLVKSTKKETLVCPWFPA